MQLIRFCLAAVNAAVACYAVWELFRQMGPYDPINQTVLWMALMFTANTLGFIFLPTTGITPGRLKRMFGLWMDAKEKELKRKAEGP